METVENDKTKNTSSHRSFPLVPEIRILLIDLKEQERANKKLFGKEYSVNDYILTSHFIFFWRKSINRHFGYYSFLICFPRKFV